MQALSRIQSLARHAFACANSNENAQLEQHTDMFMRKGRKTPKLGDQIRFSPGSDELHASSIGHIATRKCFVLCSQRKRTERATNLQVYAQGSPGSQELPASIIAYTLACKWSFLYKLQLTYRGRVKHSSSDAKGP